MSRSGRSPFVTSATIMGALGMQPSSIPVNELKYTILDIDKVAFREAKELAEICSTLVDSIPRTLVSFRPERLILHEAIAAISSKVRYQDEEEMQALIQLFLNEIRNDIPGFVSAMEQVRTRAHELARIRIEDYKNDSNDSIHKRITEIYEKANAAIRSGYVYGRHKPNYTMQNAIVAIITDEIYKEEATRMRGDFVDNQLARMIAEGKMNACIVPQANNRFTFIVAGGQSSGKGSSVYKMELRATMLGIDWKNVAKINTDSYKPLVLAKNSVDAMLYSQLAQEEASLIHQKVYDKLLKLAYKGEAPHIFVDQVFVSEDKLNLALANNGYGAAGIVVFADIDVAIERAFARGEETGRYEDTQGMLKGHKEMTRQLPDTLAKFVDRNIIIEFVDNNVPQGEEGILFMKINLQRKEIVIYDRDRLNNFIRKINININATSLNNLYTQQASVPIEDYFKALIDKQCTLTIDRAVHTTPNRQLDEVTAKRPRR